MSQQTPASWHPDPSGRFQLRYWDGARWSEHVATNGHQGIDPLAAPVSQTVERSMPVDAASDPAAVHPLPAANLPLSADMRSSKKIQKQIEKVGLADLSGTADPGVLDQPVLVINQRGKLVELRAEYAIFDQNGLQLASVRGRRLSRRMEVVDMNGRALLELWREASLVSSKVVVTGESGAKIGRIVPSKNINKVDRAFKLEGPGNELIGEVYVEDGRRRDFSRRNQEFNVQDRSGNVVARITKTRAGLAKEIFTKGDNYVLQFLDPSIGSLRSLAIAASLVIDTEFHQK